MDDSVMFSDEEQEILAITARDLFVYVQQFSANPGTCQICGAKAWKAVVDNDDSELPTIVQHAFVRSPSTGSWSFELICSVCGNLAFLGVDRVLEKKRDMIAKAQEFKSLGIKP